MNYVLFCYFIRYVSYTRTQKINAHVNFDFELNLSDYCVTNTPTTLGSSSVTSNGNNQENMYDLVSVIMHHGTGFGSGHYSSYCWNNIAGMYMLYGNIIGTTPVCSY